MPTIREVSFPTSNLTSMGYGLMQDYKGTSPEYHKGIRDFLHTINTNEKYVLGGGKLQDVTIITHKEED
jgi:hypothetical protein